jgi:hypothetical protein
LAAPVEAPVAAAGASNLATDDGLLTLEVPEGAAPAGAPMAIQPVSGAAPHAFSGLAQLAAYDVTVGEQRSFDQPLTLRFGYNPDTLREDIDPAAQLTAAYLDETTQRWVDADLVVDAAAQQVVVTTDHLTLWSLFGLDDDTVHSSHPNFDIYFSQSLDAPALSDSRSGDAIFDFAVLVRSALVTAREGYAGSGNSGLKVPAKSKVYIDNWGADATAAWGWFSKNIEIPVTYSTLGELQHDAAHELFHAVQNEYVSVATMMSNRWWMEATADYGAATLGTGSGLSSSVPLRFVTLPLNDSDDDMHMYQAAHFIRYLVDERGVDFPALFKATMASGDSVLESINAYLNTRGDSLAEAYADFAFEFVFGTAVRRDAVKTDLATDLAAVAGEHTDPGARVTSVVDVRGPYASSLAAYRVKTGIDGPFGVSLAALEGTSGISVRYVVGGPRGAGDAMWEGVLAEGTPRLVEVEDGQTIYFLVTNAAEDDGSVTVVIDAPQGETTFQSSRTAPMYNDEYTAEVAFTLESTHPFTVVREESLYGGELYYLEVKLLRPVDEDHPATFTVTAEIEGLAFADSESGGRTPAVREAYWTTPDHVIGSEATVTTTGLSGPSTRLTHEVILEYSNAEGDVYQSGGAVLVDVRIQH